MFFKAYKHLLLFFLIKEISLISKIPFSFANRTFTDYCKVIWVFPIYKVWWCIYWSNNPVSVWSLVGYFRFKETNKLHFSFVNKKIVHFLPHRIDRINQELRKEKKKINKWNHFKTCENFWVFYIRRKKWQKIWRYNYWWKYLRQEQQPTSQNQTEKTTEPKQSSSDDHNSDIISTNKVIAN